MAGLLNLLTTIAGFALAFWLVSFPEKKFLRGRSVWSLAVWEFRIEFPYQLWLIPTVGVFQIVFSIGICFLFTRLFGKYFAGASQLIILMLPLFLLGIGFPVGVVEMVKGMSINVFGKLGGKSKTVFIAEEFKKIGLYRVVSYLVAVLLMLAASLILQRIYV